MIGVIRVLTSQLEVRTCWSFGSVLCVLWLRLQHEGASTAAGQSARTTSSLTLCFLLPRRHLSLNFLNYFNFRLSKPVVTSICVNVTWVVWNGTFGGNEELRGSTAEVLNILRPKNGTCFCQNWQEQDSGSTACDAKNHVRLYSSMFSINHKGFHTLQLVVLKHLLKFQHSWLLIGVFSTLQRINVKNQLESSSYWKLNLVN